MERALAPPEVVGRYAIYGKIASGGMASVHFGRLLGGAGFSRTVAIKRLHPHLAEDPEFLSTMIDEARLAARIHHPNVVPTLDVVSAEGQLLLVMEYVRGEALSRLIKIETARGRITPLAITSAIVLGALHGLHAAHEATSDHGEPLGIVHRDVSPQNILVGVDGLARVIDFGIAKAAGRLQMTREGTVKGKVAYMSPEQLGGAEVTQSTDVYAMGVVLWEALTGRRLFHAETDAALAVQVVTGAKDPPSKYGVGIPPSLDALVMRALARTPARRFESTREMAELLTRIVPPALPTDVGEWCAEAARDLLEKRGTVLSEIESSSGVAPVMPPPSSPDIGSGSNRVVAMRSSRPDRSSGYPAQREGSSPPDALTRSDREVLSLKTGDILSSDAGKTGGRGRVSARALLGDGESEDPHLASHPSNLSMASYARFEQQAWWTKPQLVGALAGGIALGLVAAVAFWVAARPVTPMPSSASTPPVPTAVAPGAAPAPEPAKSVASPATPSATTWTTIAPAGSVPPPPLPPVKGPTSQPRTTGRPAGHGSMTFEPPPPAGPQEAPPQPPPSKPPPLPPAAGGPNCNPSFTIDTDGTKHFKPECFAR